jgi:hypothetical protein
MSDDNKDYRGNADRQRIDLEDPEEVRDWATSLAVTEEQLIEAVRTAGTQAVNVRDYLDKTVVRSQ